MIAGKSLQGWLDRADELGRQLSSAVENMELLADVMRSRRELENTFDSITDLVAVSDRRGRIVHVNHAFASRVGSSREMVNRVLKDLTTGGYVSVRDGRYVIQRKLPAAR